MISSAVRRFRFLVIVVCAPLLLDVLFFRVLFWRLPDESAWGHATLYHHEYTLRSLSRAKAAGERRIVVAGSSIAGTAVLPENLGAGIARASGMPPDSVRVTQLYFHGQHPLHLRAGVDRLIEARPDLVILPLGFVDLRLERPLVLGLADDLESARRRSAALLELRRDLMRRRLRVVAPLGALRYYAPSMPRELLGRTGLAGLFAAFRYRRQIPTATRRWLDNRFSRGRHFHQYAGMAVGGGNVTPRGYTGRRFRLRLNETLLKRGLWFEAPPRLMAKAQALGRLPRLRIRSAAGAERVMELRAGWQHLKFRGGRRGERIDFEVDPIWHAPDRADDLGVRLAERTGQSDFRRARRRIQREDDLYRGYTEAEYRRSYARRLRLFDREGMESLQSVEQARSYWHGRSFDAGLPSCVALRDWLSDLRKAGVPVVLVLAPENPLVFDSVRDSFWSRGFRAWLGGLGARALIDARDWIPMREFYDSHHLTYYGAERFSRRLARLPALLPGTGAAPVTARGPSDSAKSGRQISVVR